MLLQPISSRAGTDPAVRVQAGVGGARVDGPHRDAGLEQLGRHPGEDAASAEDYTA